MAREGRLPGAVKVGRCWRFPADLPLPEPVPRRYLGALAALPPERAQRVRESVRAIRSAS